MASYAQLLNDAKAWLKRRDIDDRFPSWVLQTETEINEQMRARCMITRGTQDIDAPLITLPTNFIAFEGVRFQPCGHLLSLEDSFTGPSTGGPDCPCASGPSWAYRLVGGCIEFLPHPQVPDPPDPSWTPQTVRTEWFAKVTPLVDPTDSNPVLNEHYSAYLFGVCRFGALFGRDDDRASQMTSAFAEAIYAANKWKTESQYSGAPLRAVVRSF